EQAESDSNRKFTVEDAIRTGAFLVAMSLWHNHPQKTQMPSMNEAVNWKTRVQRSSRYRRFRLIQIII
ncbi:phage minor tail protein domain-containing protein, partial [Bacillus sp. HC-Mk]